MTTIADHLTPIPDMPDDDPMCERIDGLMKQICDVIGDEDPTVSANALVITLGALVKEQAEGKPFATRASYVEQIAAHLAEEVGILERGEAAA